MTHRPITGFHQYQKFTKGRCKIRCYSLSSASCPPFSEVLEKAAVNPRIDPVEQPSMLELQFVNKPPPPFDKASTPDNDNDEDFDKHQCFNLNFSSNIMENRSFDNELLLRHVSNNSTSPPSNKLSSRISPHPKASKVNKPQRANSWIYGMLRSIQF